MHVSPAQVGQGIARVEVNYAGEIGKRFEVMPDPDGNILGLIQDKA